MSWCTQLWGCLSVAKQKMRYSHVVKSNCCGLLTIFLIEVQFEKPLKATPLSFFYNLAQYHSINIERG